jgi:hypothetical protein
MVVAHSLANLRCGASAAMQQIQWQWKSVSLLVGIALKRNERGVGMKFGWRLRLQRWW